MLSINLMQALDPVLFAREALGFYQTHGRKKY